MAWTTPKTWADGDIPDADDLNTHIKDNLNVVSTHTHSVAAGDGSADLSGLDTQTFDNQGSTPAAPGSNKVKLFSESETLKIRAGASGAAVAIALTNHSHAFDVDVHVDQTTYYSDGSTTVFSDLVTVSDGDDIESKTDTYAENTEIAIAGGMLGYGNHGPTNRVSVRLYFDGTLLESSSNFATSTIAWRFLKDTVTIGVGGGGSKIALLEWRNTGSAASMGQVASYLHCIAFDRA